MYPKIIIRSKGANFRTVIIFTKPTPFFRPIMLMYPKPKKRRIKKSDCAQKSLKTGKKVLKISTMAFATAASPVKEAITISIAVRNPE